MLLPTPLEQRGAETSKGFPPPLPLSGRSWLESSAGQRGGLTLSPTHTLSSSAGWAGAWPCPPPISAQTVQGNLRGLPFPLPGRPHLGSRVGQRWHLYPPQPHHCPQPAGPSRAWPYPTLCLSREGGKASESFPPAPSPRQTLAGVWCWAFPLSPSPPSLPARAVLVLWLGSRLAGKTLLCWSGQHSSGLQSILVCWGSES